MNLNLQNKKVLITGSSSGIGLQIANSFLEEGAIVGINGRKSEKLNKSIKKKLSSSNLFVIPERRYTIKRFN